MSEEVNALLLILIVLLIGLLVVGFFGIAILFEIARLVDRV